MPIVVSPSQQAWVRVSPRRRKLDREGQVDAIRDSLAYFSCVPAPSSQSQALVRTNGGIPCPKYDLEERSPGGGGGGRKGKGRAVSAPVRTKGAGGRQHHHHHHDNDDASSLGEDDYRYGDDGYHDHGASMRSKHRNTHHSSSSHNQQHHQHSSSGHHRSQSRAASSSHPHRHSSSQYPTPRAAQPAYRSSGGNFGGRNTSSTYHRAASTVSRSWANATQALDLG